MDNVSYKNLELCAFPAKEKLLKCIEGHRNTSVCICVNYANVYSNTIIKESKKEVEIN
jgi:hypothetical protein